MRKPACLRADDNIPKGMQKPINLRLAGMVVYLVLTLPDRREDPCPAVGRNKLLMTISILYCVFKLQSLSVSKYSSTSQTFC